LRGQVERFARLPTPQSASGTGDEDVGEAREVAGVKTPLDCRPVPHPPGPLPNDEAVALALAQRPPLPGPLAETFDLGSQDFTDQLGAVYEIKAHPADLDGGKVAVLPRHFHGESQRVRAQRTVVRDAAKPIAGARRIFRLHPD